MTQQATCEKKRALILLCCFWGSTMPILQSRSHRELHGVRGRGTSVVLPSTHSSAGSCCVLHVWCNFIFFPTFQFLIQQLNFLSNSYDNGHILDSYISKALEKTTLLIPGNPYFKQWNNFFPLLQTPPNSINPLPFRLPHPQVMALFSVSEEVLKKHSYMQSRWAQVVQRQGAGAQTENKSLSNVCVHQGSVAIEES